MRWFDRPVRLTGTRVELVPLDTGHIDALLSIAAEKRIWEHFAVDGSHPQLLRSSLEQAIHERALCLQYPFVIWSRQQNKIVGSTRFLDIRQEHKKLEIGWTWMAPVYWGKNINAECKFLLLEYCFEQLEAVRVQFRTDENNVRSRKAIEKTGARQEGIVRNDMIRSNGTQRNSVLYSIINSEWEFIKPRLAAFSET